MDERPAHQVFEDAGVRFAYLFGSRAGGNARPDGDADIAFVARSPLGLLDEAALADRLAVALEVPSVDLVDLERAPLVLAGRVLTVGRTIFSADEPGRVEFEVRTRAEYFDFLPYQREHRDAYLRRVAAGHARA
ncbi:type VII toxin-antitoxin system MntA family adenylyltransferase antitoxin [Pseudonocardia parietis]|uniref:Nucleotidyltransferase n=1 Tax=Pseudonocardia parietis TaxID=570936 RepID=A0ABS4VY46_9PSEU|nr:nucleotidyltransferase domain-containing protein [Pseudonocardia parietis]MBP2368820.1 putative nucleotidyltransferase [Pseudonocardia parietis]